MPLSRSARFLVAGFAASGTIHLLKPEVYLPLMPSWVPAHREVVLGSGVVEIALAAGMAAPQTRRLASLGAVGLLLGVWPANIKMALDSQRSKSPAFKAAAWGRVPLQVPMIRIALRAARS